MESAGNDLYLGVPVAKAVGRACGGVRCPDPREAPHDGAHSMPSREVRPTTAEVAWTAAPHGSGSGPRRRARRRLSEGLGGRA